MGALTAILQSHPICRAVVVVETKEFAAEQFFFKIRATLTSETHLQARIYYNHEHIDYAYQVFSDVPLLRWDNKEEFRHIATYPHHHHNEHGDITSSPLVGNPIHDIAIVLQNVSEFLGQHTGE